MRIERFVALHSNPRRTKIEARRLILDGAVTVNGGIVARIGFQVFLGAYSTEQMFFYFLKVYTDLAGNSIGALSSHTSNTYRHCGLLELSSTAHPHPKAIAGGLMHPHDCTQC